jgi:hypothetical protein
MVAQTRTGVSSAPGSSYFDKSTPLFSQAIPVFMETMADEIVRRVKEYDRGCMRITAFTEFFGAKQLRRETRRDGT